MEEQLQQELEGLLGNYLWLFISGLLFLMFKSTIESLVEGIKVFLGKDLNTDDVVILDGRPARVVRVGMWKTIFFVYEVGTVIGEPYVKGGNKVAIQNDQLKVHIIEKPLPMLDLSKWKEK